MRDIVAVIGELAVEQHFKFYQDGRAAIWRLVDPQGYHWDLGPTPRTDKERIAFMFDAQRAGLVMPSPR